MNAELLSILSYPEQHTVSNLIFNENPRIFITNTRMNFWIGLSDISKENKFVWSDSSKFTDKSYQNWMYGEPNNLKKDKNNTDDPGQDCVSGIFRHGMMTWNDDFCNRRLPFICKKELGKTYDAMGFSQ